MYATLAEVNEVSKIRYEAAGFSRKWEGRSADIARFWNVATVAMRIFENDPLVKHVTWEQRGQPADLAQELSKLKREALESAAEIVERLEREDVLRRVVEMSFADVTRAARAAVDKGDKLQAGQLLDEMLGRLGVEAEVPA